MEINNILLQVPYIHIPNVNTYSTSGDPCDFWAAILGIVAGKLLGAFLGFWIVMKVLMVIDGTKGSSFIHSIKAIKGFAKFLMGKGV